MKKGQKVLLTEITVTLKSKADSYKYSDTNRPRIGLAKRQQHFHLDRQIDQTYQVLISKWRLT
jgi:hypothetical protein